MSDILLQSISNRVATLTLNRPDARNALTIELRQLLIEALQRLGDDPEVGAIVITGAGNTFCAGGDLKRMGEISNASPAQRLTSMRDANRLPTLITSLPKIVIAAVNGAATGAGLGIACACDLRMATTTARFGTAFVKVGLASDYGMSWTLTRIVGPAKASELILLGDVIDSADALKIGLVSRLAEPAAFDTEVAAFAARFAQGPGLALELLKKNLAAATTSTFAEQLEREAEHQAFALGSEDHREAVAAFLAKREPVFKGH